MDKILPLQSMENILKKAGAVRIAHDGKVALRDVLESKGDDISRRAITFAAHAGRKTIKAEDIKLAAKE